MRRRVLLSFQNILHYSGVASSVAVNIRLQFGNRPVLCFSAEYIVHNNSRKYESTVNYHVTLLMLNIHCKEHCFATFNYQNKCNITTLFFLDIEKVTNHMKTIYLLRS